MTGIYLHDWAGGNPATILEDFGVPLDTLDGAEVLVASYSYEDYSGDAYVLFRRDGKLFEATGSHCSCYGLSENHYDGNCKSQWEPEETTAEAVLHRVNEGHWFTDGVSEAVIKALT